MDKEAFKKYIQSRKKLDSEYKNLANKDEEYNKYLETKKNINERTKQWYSDKIQNDDEFKEKRKQYNKKSYDTLKSKKTKTTSTKESNEHKITLINEPLIINRSNNENDEKITKSISMLDINGYF